MFRNKKIAVIIAAAGFGKRMGGGMPKQYREISGKSILVRSVEAFSTLLVVDYICVVTSSEYIEYCRRELVDKAGLDKITMIVKGGVERQDSVCRGLEALAKETDFDYVLIHDAARPFVTTNVIMNVLEAALQHDAAVAAVQSKDTMRLTVEANAIGASKTLDRDRLYSVQTPQGFERNLILRAYQRAYDRNFFSTDDAALVEYINERVVMAAGDYANIKITTQEDMPMETRVGTGFDAHAFAEGRKLILGGVEIPYDKGLQGHSDADVLIHAIIDALLGAAGLGDIGRHFPETDPLYKNMSSVILLERVGTLLAKEKFTIVNIDATLIAQKPKIVALTSKMKAIMAETLNIAPERINLKGTTTEKLGFTGREEGIAAQATCSLVR